jgi:hypothetical protein
MMSAYTKRHGVLEMKLVVDHVVRISGQSTLDEQVVVHIWSTHPLGAPWFVEIAAHSCPVTVDLPSSATYDALIFEMLVNVTSDDDRVVRGHAGRGVARASECARGELDLFNPTRTRKVGWVKFSIELPPRSDGFDPDCPSTTATCDKLAAQASAWFEHGRPVDSEVQRVHIPKLPGIFKDAPGFVFAAHRPCEPENDDLFERAVLVAARRRGVNAHMLAVKVISEINVPEDHPSQEVLHMAQFLAEGVQLIVNNISYLADPDIDKDKVETIDRFSTDVRMTLAGDCEDCAREIAQLWSLACKCKGSTPLVRAIALIARCYVACEHLGAVALRGSAFLDVYSTGGSLYAHAFCQIIPASWFDAALHNDDAFNKMKLAPNMLVPWTSGLRTLTLDGVRLCDSDAFQPSFPYKQLSNVDDDLRTRLKCMEPTGTKHYIFVSSSYVFGALQATNGCPIYEIAYLQSDGRYGARFAQMHESPPHLRVMCTHGAESCRDDSRTTAEALCRYFHPVTKWDTAGAPDEAAIVEQARKRLSAAGVRLTDDEPPASAVHTVVGPIEIGDGLFLHALATQLGSKYENCKVLPERLARGVSSAMLVLW